MPREEMRAVRFLCVALLLWTTLLPDAGAQETGADGTDSFPSLVEHRKRLIAGQFPGKKFTFFCDDGVMPRPYLVAYELRPNEDPETVERELAEIFTHLREQFYRRFGEALELEEEIPRPVVVVVFSSFESYQEFWKAHPDRALDIGLYPPFPGLGGFYSHRSGRLYLWRRTDDAEFWRVAFHEGSHQLVAAAMRPMRTTEDFLKLTPWLQEGIAEFLGGHKRTLVPDGQGGFRTEFELGRFLPDRFECVRSARLKGKALDLRSLVGLDGLSFATLKASGSRRDYETVLLVYAESWALTKYLHDAENGRYRKALRDLLATEARLEGGLGAFERILGLENEDDWRAFEEGFWRWFDEDLTAQSSYAELKQAGREPENDSRESPSFSVELPPEDAEERAGTLLLLAAEGDLPAALEQAGRAGVDPAVERFLERLADLQSRVLDRYRSENRSLRLIEPGSDRVLVGKVAGSNARAITLRTRTGTQEVPRRWLGPDLLISLARKLRMRDPEIEAFAAVLAGQPPDVGVRRARIRDEQATVDLRRSLERVQTLLDAARLRRDLDELASSAGAPADRLADLERFLSEHSGKPRLRRYREALVSYARSLLPAAYRSSGFVEDLADRLHGEVTYRDGLLRIAYGFDGPGEVTALDGKMALSDSLRQLLPALVSRELPDPEHGVLRMEGPAMLRCPLTFAGQVRARARVYVEGSTGLTLMLAQPSVPVRSLILYVGLQVLIYTHQEDLRFFRDDSTPKDLPVLRWTTLEMDYDAGHVRVTADGKVRAEATDATLHSGCFALVVQEDCICSIDELEIEGRPDLESLAPFQREWVEKKLAEIEAALTNG